MRVTCCPNCGEYGHVTCALQHSGRDDLYFDMEYLNERMRAEEEEELEIEAEQEAEAKRGEDVNRILNSYQF